MIKLEQEKALECSQAFLLEKLVFSNLILQRNASFFQRMNRPCGLPVDEFKDTFQIDRLPKEEQAHFRTLNGFIVSYLGRIPTVADRFEWGGYRFEVMDMDRNRVDKVLVTPPSPSRLKKG